MESQGNKDRSMDRVIKTGENFKIRVEPEAEGWRCVTLEVGHQDEIHGETELSLSSPVPTAGSRI